MTFSEKPAIDVPSMPGDVQAIRSMAIAAHGDQKYGSEPYFVHLDEVAAMVLSYGWDYVKLAYCHDLLEDVPKTIEEHRYWENKILGLTDQQFLDDCLLLKDEPGANRKERKAKTYAKMREANSDFLRALVVKVADRLANVRACHKNDPKKLKMYTKEHPAFVSSVCRDGVAVEMTSELDDMLRQPEPTLDR